MYVNLPYCSTTYSTRTAGAAGLGRLGCGGAAGCSCGGSCGVGDVTDSLSSLSDTLSAEVLGIPVWAMLLLGGSALLFLGVTPGGREYREKKRKLADEYRGYKRVGRRVKRGARRVAGMEGKGSFFGGSA